MRNLSCFKAFLRQFSSVARSAIDEASTEKCFNRMTAWQIHSYGNLDELQLSSNVKKPYIRSPTEILVKVNASSVNPIDVEMIGGYGSKIFNAIRCKSDSIEFPLTMGRDFVGTVVQKGMSVYNTELEIGDKIWGVVPVHKQGCHSEYITVDKCYVLKKPTNISDSHAAAILYAGLTAFSGIFISGQHLNEVLAALCSSHFGTLYGKKVLVLGGSGGVGHLALQILQAEGADVVTTCSQSAAEAISKLGDFKIIDYTSTESDGQLIKESPYNLILDCAAKGAEYSKTLPWTYDHYVTFRSPMLKNFDKDGLIVGGLNNVKDLIQHNIPPGSGNGLVKWGYFVPSQTGIQYLGKLVENGKLQPVIDSVFKYSELPKAYERVQGGNLRGKVVVEYD